MISAICLTYGRVSHLEQAIQGFLNQTYDGPCELIVFNTFNKQRLQGEFPNVRIINAERRPPNLGACRNAAIELAREGWLLIWDDDDSYLPHHLETFARHIQPGLEWLWMMRQFYADGPKIKSVVPGSCNVFAFTKAAWRKVGGYPQRNSGEDRDLLTKISVGPGKKIELQPQEASFIYAWNNGTYHASGLGDDKQGEQSGHERIRIWTEDRARRGLIPTGDIQLQPHLNIDYSAQARDFLGLQKTSAPQPDDVAIVQLGRFGDICNVLPIAQHIASVYKKPHWIVSREFASIFDGVSYVIPHPVDLRHDQLSEGLVYARRHFTHIIQAQIWGRNYPVERQCESYNKESWRKAGLLNRFNDLTWRPVFDRRDRDREAGLLAKVR